MSRRLLKAALRVYGLRCIAVEELVEKGLAVASDTPCNVEAEIPPYEIAPVW